MNFCETCASYVQYEGGLVHRDKEPDTILFDYKDCPLYIGGTSKNLVGLWYSVKGAKK